MKTDEEASEIIRIALDNLHAYFDEVGATKGEGDPTLVVPFPRLLLSNATESHTANVMKSSDCPKRM